MKIITEEDRRKKKNGALGWFMTIGGNPEKEVEFFNHVMGNDSSQDGSNGESSSTASGDAGGDGGATAGAGGAQ